MKEVLQINAEQIDASDVLNRQGLTPGGYFLVSLHREENVDNPERLEEALQALNELAVNYGLPVLISTHPRTRKRLEMQSDTLKEKLRFHPPFGFNDYIKLQKSAKLVLSDSGTISEESLILGFPAVTLRDFIERPEALDVGGMVTAGLSTTSIIDSVRLGLEQFEDEGIVDMPPEYAIDNVSRRTVNFIRSTVHSHRQRMGYRMWG